MNIVALDHLVLTVADIPTTIEFYSKILGMTEQTFGDNRKALLFGKQKINLHQRGAEIQPNAQNANTGTADLCLLTDTPLEQVQTELQAHRINLLKNGQIVQRTGAIGIIRSLYFYDPDGNLLEISQYI